MRSRRSQSSVPTARRCPERCDHAGCDSQRAPCDELLSQGASPRDGLAVARVPARRAFPSRSPTCRDEGVCLCAPARASHARSIAVRARMIRVRAREPIDPDALTGAHREPGQAARGERHRREKGAGDRDSLPPRRQAGVAAEAPALDTLAQPSSQHLPGLPPPTVSLGELQRQVAQVVAIALSAQAWIREQAQIQEAPPHADFGLYPGAVAERALSAAAVERSRAVSSASTVSPALVSR